MGKSNRRPHWFSSSLNVGFSISRLTPALEYPVILQQFIKGDRLIAVDIHPGVEHVVPGS